MKFVYLLLLLSVAGLCQKPPTHFVKESPAQTCKHDLGLIQRSIEMGNIYPDDSLGSFADTARNCFNYLPKQSFVILDKVLSLQIENQKTEIAAREKAAENWKALFTIAQNEDRRGDYARTDFLMQRPVRVEVTNNSQPIHCTSEANLLGQIETRCH